MPPEDRTRLLHMVEAAEAARSFVVGRQRADLDSDRMLLFALVRAIEIVGEAASNVSPATRAAIPGLPRSAIVGMRNRIVHAYFISIMRLCGRRCGASFRNCWPR